jgi:signal transduction histidine kinase
MIRLVLNLVLTGLAIALLGVLVLLSTTPEEAVRRSFDQSMRQLRELGMAVERDALNARNLNLEQSERLKSLERQLVGAIESVSRDLGVLYPAEPATTARARALAETAFNSIGPDRGVERDFIWRQFVALDQASRWFADRTSAFRRHHGNYLAQREQLADSSRAFVQKLRERGQSGQADLVFRAVQQVLERANRGGASDLEQIDAIAERLAAAGQLRASADRASVVAITETMRALVPARRGMEASLAEIGNGRFQRQLANLREIVTRDHLFRLGTVNDSRVLLNVYTVLLLVMLGYFGFRLQLSYRALNRSHEALEVANASLEERVSERTRDLEQALEDLKESQVQLVQAEKMSSLGQLVAGVVHEINTPLLYVLNNATVTAENVQELRAALERAASVARMVRAGGAGSRDFDNALAELASALDPDTVVDTIDEIQALAADSTEGIEQISELVKSLKDFSRLDRAAEDRFDVRDGLEKTLLITRNLLKYGVEVERRFEDVPLVLCAPSRINQVFINLITNAVQAMDGKGHLTLSTRRVGDRVEIGVRDTGSGIAPENLSKIMDPFFTTKPVGQGTGLGLSIVRKIVDEHGGEIRVQSQLGEGTEITISLPIERASGVLSSAEAA